MVSVHACGTPGELLTLSEPGIYSIRVISAVKGAMGTHLEGNKSPQSVSTPITKSSSKCFVKPPVIQIVLFFL